MSNEVIVTRNTYNANSFDVEYTRSPKVLLGESVEWTRIYVAVLDSVQNTLHAGGYKDASDVVKAKNFLSGFNCFNFSVTNPEEHLKIIHLKISGSVFKENNEKVSGLVTVTAEDISGNIFKVRLSGELSESTAKIIRAPYFKALVTNTFIFNDMTKPAQNETVSSAPVVQNNNNEVVASNASRKRESVNLSYSLNDLDAMLREMDDMVSHIRFMQKRIDTACNVIASYRQENENGGVANKRPQESHARFPNDRQQRPVRKEGVKVNHAEKNNKPQTENGVPSDGVSLKTHRHERPEFKNRSQDRQQNQRPKKDSQQLDQHVSEPEQNGVLMETHVVENGHVYQTPKRVRVSDTVKSDFSDKLLAALKTQASSPSEQEPASSNDIKEQSESKVTPLYMTDDVNLACGDR